MQRETHLTTDKAKKKNTSKNNAISEIKTS